MKNKNINITDFIIKDSNLSKNRIPIYCVIISLIFINIILPFLSLFIFPQIIDGEIDLFFIISIIIAVNIIFFPAVLNVIRKVTPIQKTKITISNKELNLYLQEQLYCQIFLSEIEKIEFIYIRWYGFKIDFINPTKLKELRLFLYIFKKKKQKLIINYLKQVAKNLNINYIEMKEKSDDNEKLEKLENEIKSFIKKYLTF